MSDSDYKEKLIAIRFLQPNDDFCEIYHVVCNRDCKNPRLEVINYAIPEAELKKISKELANDYGQYKKIGITYNYFPYNLGTKRIASYMVENAREQVKALYSRENQEQILVNRCANDLEDLENTSEYIDQIREMTDSEYQAWADEEAKLFLEEALVTITPQEAELKFQEFLLMNSAQENIMRDNYISRRASGDKLLKNVHYRNR